MNLENVTQQYAAGLQEMKFISTQQLREPINHLLVLAKLIDISAITQQDLSEISRLMKASAHLLDDSSKELTEIINNQEKYLNG